MLIYKYNKLKLFPDLLGSISDLKLFFYKLLLK